jgi:hypothetical protein
MIYPTIERDAEGRPARPAFRPTLHFDLRAQPAPLVQGSLFRQHSTFNIEHPTPRACEHPATQPQLTFDGATDRTCTRCGARMEPII